MTRSLVIANLRSRRLEVVMHGLLAKERTGAREGDTRHLSPRVSPSRTFVFSCAHYFQGPATQASSGLLRSTIRITCPITSETHLNCTPLDPIAS